MKKIIFFLIPIILSANIWLNPFTASKHYKPTPKCEKNPKCLRPTNETHKSIGFIYDINNSYSIGVVQYTNSYNLQSKSITVSKIYPINKYLAFSINGGFVDGYPKQNEFNPIVFPSIILKYKRVALDIAGTHEVIFASFRIKIW